MRQLFRSTLSHHVPDDRQIGTKNATEGLKDGVCAERYVVPREVETAVAEHDSQTERRNDTGPALSSRQFDPDHMNI